MRRILRSLAKVLTAFVVILTALLVVGTVLNGPGYLGWASFIVGAAPAWFVILPLAGALAAWAVWRGRRTRFGNALLGIAVIAAIGGTLITVRMMSAYNGAGVDVGIVQSITRISPSASATPDAEPVYLRSRGEDLRVAVYRPGRSRRAAPVLFYIHGGGWTIGSRADHSADMRWFADQGYLVLSIDYTLSDDKRHLWNVTQGQVGCAMAWIRENAKKYGGDADRLSLTGDSAGGNLAINTSYLQAAGKLPSTCGGRTPDVSALSVTYPGVDLDAIRSGSPLGVTFTDNYIGGSTKRFPKRYAATNSSTYITPEAPPTHILAGRSDHLVPFGSIKAFAEKAQRAGIETKLVSIPYADHVFDQIPGNLGSQANRQLTVSWLRRHGQRP